MPQPLSKVAPRAMLVMGGSSLRPLQHNPPLGVMAMEAIISWSNVEAFLLDLYLQILGGPQSLAAISYLSLDTKGPKTAALKAAAQAALDEASYKLLDALLKRVNQAGKSRDKLAHWKWGYSPELPDAFMLAGPRSNLKDFRSGQGGDYDRSKVIVFKQRDFEDIINENDLLCRMSSKLLFILVKHPVNLDGRLSRELSLELRMPKP